MCPPLGVNLIEFVIRFDMMSIRIDSEEVEEILLENISGRVAKEIKKSGDGMGLYIVKRLLKLNNAELNIFPNANYRGLHMLNGIPYQNNVFEFRFRNQFV